MKAAKQSTSLARCVPSNRPAFRRASQLAILTFASGIAATANPTATGNIAILASLPPFPGGDYIPAIIVGLVCSVLAVRVLIHRSRAAQSARMAEDRFRLLADMSHELRTPLNGILGVASLLADTPLNQKQRESLAQIRSSGESLLSVINNVLDLARLEAGAFSVESDSIDLRDFLDEIVGLFAPIFQVGAVEILAYCDPGIPSQVKVDRTKVRQILINLVGNAAKFTTRGHVHIHVSSFAFPTGDSHLRFEVTDTGPGIHPEEKSRLFAAFQQTHAGRESTVKGTGLGLVISKRLAAFMGGQLSFESEIGKGSRFWFHVPFVPVPGSEPVDAAMDSGNRVNGLERAVVMTNTSLMREELKRMLAVYGFDRLDLCSPSDFNSAVTSSNRRVDLLVVDAEPEGESLLNIVHETRALRPNDPVPVLVLCNGTQQMDRMQRAQLPALLPVIKPLQREQVAAALDALLDPHSGLTKLAASVGGDAFKKLSPPGSRTQQAPSVLRLLVAEDNPVNRRVMSGMIERLGHEVVVVSDGHEALYTALSEGPFHMIFLDCSMPRMDGFEVARRIRESESPARQIPVVAVTAHAHPEIRQECLDSGMTDVVLKPISLRTLSEMINRYGSVPSHDHR